LVGEKRLERLATDIIDSEEADDEYVITLKDGGKIRPGEIVLRSIVDLPRMGKSVDRDEARDALTRYYMGLKEEGRLGE
jgi:hypothetical protein